MPSIIKRVLEHSKRESDKSPLLVQKEQKHHLGSGAHNSSSTEEEPLLVLSIFWKISEKDTPCAREKEKLKQDGRRGEIMFRIKPHTRQRYLEDSNNTLWAVGPGDSAETDPDLPLSVWVYPTEVWVNSGLPQGHGLWVQQSWVWHKPT